jgi:hypothetical protein
LKKEYIERKNDDKSIKRKKADIDDETQKSDMSNLDGSVANEKSPAIREMD